MQHERICFIGGTGSLGTEYIRTFIKDNIIMVVSRNEDKQWFLKQGLPAETTIDNLSFCLGDISQYHSFKQHIYAFEPTIIIYGAALKHVDNCEKQIDLCVAVNFQGMHTVLADIQCQRAAYPALKTVVFVSTDKACLPVTVYGQTKAITEKLMQTTRIPGVKCITVRFGNLLNSTGSILPILHKIGENPSSTHFNLTHRNMIRFLMRFSDSVELIQYAIMHGKNNEIIVPKHICSCRIEDMMNLFSEIYKKPVRETQLRCVEKLYESLVSPYEVPYTNQKDNIICISPDKQSLECNIPGPLSSNETLLSCADLKSYLTQHKYI